MFVDDYNLDVHTYFCIYLSINVNTTKNTSFKNNLIISYYLFQKAATKTIIQVVQVVTKLHPPKIEDHQHRLWVWVTFSNTPRKFHLPTSLILRGTKTQKICWGSEGIPKICYVFSTSKRSRLRRIARLDQKIKSPEITLQSSPQSQSGRWQRSKRAEGILVLALEKTQQPSCLLTCPPQKYFPENNHVTWTGTTFYWKFHLPFPSNFRGY